MRQILPKNEVKNANRTAEASTEGRSNKRRCISSACRPCRKRKSKCDGGLPSCSTCIAVYKTECEYDTDVEARRKSALKQDPRQRSAERNDALSVIITSLRELPEAEVLDLVQQIRSDENIEALAESLKTNVTLSRNPAKADTSNLESDLSVIVRKPSINEAGTSRQYGLTSSLSLVPEDEHYGVAAARNDHLPGSWTAVTRDTELIQHLLDLYFAWAHPFYIMFSKECFLHDMAKGRTKYCSPLLVNAILAQACHFSDRPAARTMPEDSRTAGDHFFAEARRLLYENDSSCLTTVQALSIMAIREAACSRDSSGFQYAGRSIRMALELGLHLSVSTSGQTQLSPSEIEVRKITFWGCFTADTVWSVCIGRISQLPRAAIDLDKPSLVDTVDATPWKPYVEGNLSLGKEMEQPNYSHRFLQQFSLLSELVNDNVFMFYAPRERFTSRRLLDCYSKYQDWYRRLPECLQLERSNLPHVLVLHMLYHCCVLHLFRPFLKVDLMNSSVRPREICSSCATQISDLVSRYRQIYGLRRGCITLCHVLLSACTIHLVDLPSVSAARYISEGLEDLDTISTNHYFAVRCNRIIVSLAKKWGIALPERAKKYEDSSSQWTSPTASGSFFIPGYNSSTDNLGAQVQRQLNNTKGLRPNSGLPQTPLSDGYQSTSHTSYARSRSSMDASMFQANVSDAQQAPTTYAGAFSPPIHPSAHLQNAQNPASRAPQEQIFWSPFPGQGIPLRASNVSGPMDLNALLGTDEWEQFTRDGFRIANNVPQPRGQAMAQGEPGVNGAGVRMAGSAWAQTHT